MGIIESVVDKKEIIKRTYGEIRKYKEANQPAYERFTVSPSLFRPDILSKERGYGRAATMDGEAQV
jgi:hypothetical protein